jgi:hypothetical protein
MGGPIEVIRVAVGCGDDREVLDGVGDAVRLEEVVELLEFVSAAAVLATGRREVPALGLIECGLSWREGGAEVRCWASDTATRGVRPYG